MEENLENQQQQIIEEKNGAFVVQNPVSIL